MSFLLTTDKLSKYYEVSQGLFKPKAVIKALDEMTLRLESGKTLAVVGESGCGKSTLARVLTMIELPTSGSFSIEGQPVDENDWERLRQDVQIVFQNPYSSLNPRKTVGDLLIEPLINYRPNLSNAERLDKAREMLSLVGLRPEHLLRYPHMFSGGQRQRIAVGRALMLEPKILILDEPVSALDLSVQSKTLNLLIELQERFGLAYIFISHDLTVVRHMADDVIVMYLGRAVEYASVDEIFNNAQHPYTDALIASAPLADPTVPRERRPLEGELPSPLNVPDGCVFAQRCRNVQDYCRKKRPQLNDGEHQTACFFPIEKLDRTAYG